MSAPAPVPSKAAIHALRGLLFGTSCSLVLLAEERRQRIKIARSAVENGRRLKSLKRYSSSGGAAVAALQEEAATDPNFAGWSSRSRRGRSFNHNEHGNPVSESSYLSHISHDLGPDPRRPTRQAREEREERGKKEVGGPSTAATAQRPTKDETIPNWQHKSATDAAKQASNDPFWARFANGNAASTTASVSGLGDITRSGVPPKGSKINSAIANIVNVFCTRNPQFQESGDLYSAGHNPYSPEAAVSLVLRAYNSTANSRELPSWLIELSSRLCVACQKEGHLDAAAQIMRIIVNHGPISLRDYVAHRPIELIGALISHKPVRDAGDPALAEYVSLIRKLYTANIADIGQVRRIMRRDYIKVGKESMLYALKANRGADAVKMFERAKYLSKAQLEDTTWFIQELIKYYESTLAIDVFVGSYANLGASSESMSICGKVVDCVRKSKGHAALAVLDVINRLRLRDGWSVPGSWVEELLWSHWRSARNYEATRKLFNHLLNNSYYNITVTHGIRRRMVRICIEADDLTLARLHYEGLCLLHPYARTDAELLGAFTLQKAHQNAWEAVRSDFESLISSQPFLESQLQEFNRLFVGVLRIFSKSHTWGEVETFMATYVKDLGVTLDRHLVRLIADRHGRCRDIQAMSRWLKFCKDAKFAADPVFWTAIFTSCTRDWGFTAQEMQELYRELSLMGVDRDFPDMKKCFRTLVGFTPTTKLAHARWVSHRINPADERRTFERMKLEAQHENWAVVQSIYNRAVHNQMGHSSRCLHLAVQACIKKNGIGCKKAAALLTKAQDEGHDISGAIVPLLLAQLDELSEQEMSKNDRYAGRRGRPYNAIKTLLAELKTQGLHIHNAVYDRAARVCINLRNYKEAAAICVTAADSNADGDLCYNVSNFRNLLHVYTARHEYDKVSWLVSQAMNREYRFSASCRYALTWACHYLQAAADRGVKSEELRETDLAMLAYIQKARETITNENAALKAGAHDAILDAIAGGKRKPAPTPPRREAHAMDATTHDEAHYATEVY